MATATPESIMFACGLLSFLVWLYLAVIMQIMAIKDPKVKTKSGHYAILFIFGLGPLLFYAYISYRDRYPSSIRPNATSANAGTGVAGNANALAPRVGNGYPRPA